MEDFIVNGFVDFLGFTPKQVFAIFVLYCVSPKILSWIAKLFLVIKNFIGCGFELKCEQIGHGAYDRHIKVFIKTKSKYKLFKTETQINPANFPWMKTEDINIDRNPPEEFKLGGYSLTSNIRPKFYTVIIKVIYKKRFSLKEKDKIFSFTFQS